ncbi:hypothetical protein [Paenibacillus sp. AN1007]|uniref:Uncharacterized protein n=1 Tax=Paenibacillus sp. AN1007 TaxID=3151385 RepID=A0AAU8N6D4_9BACL
MNISNIISIVTPFITGTLGFLFGARIFKFQRRFNFIERQLNELYSPMLGIIKDIKTKSSIRTRISNIANEIWKEEVREWQKSGGTVEKPDIEPYLKIIDYDNKQLKEELIPQYQNILKLLITNYSLADEETTEWQFIFSEYIEIWNRALTESIPRVVIEKLEQSESKHDEFYDHIEKKVKELKGKLKPKPLWKRINLIVLKRGR